MTLTRLRVERIVRACHAQRARERADGCEQRPTQTQRLAEELLEAWGVLDEFAAADGRGIGYAAWMRLMDRARAIVERTVKAKAEAEAASVVIFGSLPCECDPKLPPESRCTDGGWARCDARQAARIAVWEAGQSLVFRQVQRP